MDHAGNNTTTYTIFNLSSKVNHSGNKDHNIRRNIALLELELFTKSSINVFLVIYSLVFVIGMISNILICTLMVLKRRMKSAINIYTFNLAICDILILAFYVPTQAVMICTQLNWVMGDGMCNIANIVLPVTLTCTIGCLLAIALDRVRALAVPLKWRADSLGQSKILMVVIWVISFLINTPLFIYPKIIHIHIVHEEKDHHYTFCTMGWPNKRDGEIFWFSIFILLYCVPLITMIFAYATMVFVVWRSHRINENFHKKVIIMGIKLVAVFATCTGFQHIFFFMTSSYRTVHLPRETLAMWYAISNLFVSLQAAINPFVYRNFGNLYKERTSSTSSSSGLLSALSTLHGRLIRRMSQRSVVLFGIPKLVKSDEVKNAACHASLKSAVNGGHATQAFKNEITADVNHCSHYREAIQSKDCFESFQNDKSSALPDHYPLLRGFEDNVVDMIRHGYYIQKATNPEILSTDV